MRTSIPLWCRIEEQSSTLARLYYRLMLVVGPSRSGKTTALRRLSTERCWPLVNVSLALSERLLELTSRQHAFAASRLLDQVTKEPSGDVLLLDNTEILFNCALRLDPLRLLQGIARHRSVIASWAGHCDNGPLTYAVPGHPEFRQYENPDVVVVPTGST
ncbi:MAG: BREX-3 system P-loop-containing protein BrxF [Bryobacterales bacterium]|nr:BREX-3 system P-loop-containing protein BrxF [Bryobacterales bacterium]